MILCVGRTSEFNIPRRMVKIKNECTTKMRRMKFISSDFSYFSASHPLESTDNFNTMFSLCFCVLKVERDRKICKQKFIIQFLNGIFYCCSTSQILIEFQIFRHSAFAFHMAFAQLAILFIHNNDTERVSAILF